MTPTVPRHPSHLHALTDVCTHERTHVHPLAHPHAFTDMCTLARPPACLPARTHAHMHAPRTHYTCMRSHSQSHMHMHAQTPDIRSQSNGATCCGSSNRQIGPSLHAWPSRTCIGTSALHLPARSCIIRRPPGCVTPQVHLRQAARPRTGKKWVPWKLPGSKVLVPGWIRVSKFWNPGGSGFQSFATQVGPGFGLS